MRANAKNQTNGLHKEMHALKNAAVTLVGKVKKTSQERSHEAINTVVKHPYKTLGIACGIGLIVGMLLKK
ncbi:MAG: hypothetical protein COB66_01950 [Coxiella sp. (in: Bacteria)]|nr:MAG: hypothetical protein COB66_01950 [Coxiella sp. (in: g-proteobacteria)]